MKNILKTRDEMHEMSLDELGDYEHELYLLWNEAGKIKTYRRMMKEERILLNTPNIINSKLLTNGDEEE
jgi:hypothetical protein|tara:strand:+ start:332 stop:538 length:207 start_codon:yes stop_codon:yes gene_type:complete